MGTGAGLPKHDPETGFFRGVAGEFWGRTHSRILSRSGLLYGSIILRFVHIVA